MSTAYSSAKQQYIGNGVTTEWGFDFPIKKHSELKVYLKRSTSPQVLLEEGVDYSFVTDNTITFPIKTGEAKLQATDVLALQRESVFESEYNFSNQQRLEPEEVMHADDNLERQIQELKRDVTQAIRIQPTSNIDTDEYFVAVESIYENLDNINNVSGISAEIVNCSDNISDISTVSSNIANVNAVGQSISNVNTVASNVSSVNTVSGSISDVNTVAGIASSVPTVADNSVNVTTVATNISDVNTAATNIAAIQEAYNNANTAQNSATQAAQSATASAASAQQAAISAAGTHFKLFQHQWFDYELNDLAWLRADTFSWQSGTVYANAYNHLVADIDGISPATETVGGQTVTFYRAADGHKIVLADQETTVGNIYTSTGVAWYYILDTVNNRFKLPRTKYGFNGLRGNVGDYIPESLPNISGGFTVINDGTDKTLKDAFGCNYLTHVAKSNYPYTNAKQSSADYSVPILHTDASRSSSAYQNGAPVQQRGTQQYLYFYVGQYTQSAIEQTAGLNAELFNNKIDIDGNNVIAAGANKILNTSSYTTNRILEIPQDIKLELNNGTLTLKAGSKVYVPNGFEADGTTPKFDEVVIASDSTETRSFNTNYKLQHFYDVSNNSFGNPFQIGFNLFSGNTAPSGFQAQINLWYDTSANLMKYTADNGSTWSVVNYSLPLCVFSSPTNITSIDQIFNGFGYIGSTVFALPGVKVQIPNGRNEDGTYNYLLKETKSVTTRNLSGFGFNQHIMINSNGGIAGPTDKVKYDSELNSYIYTHDNSKQLWCIFAELNFESGKITYFEPYTVDSIVNSNASNFSQAGRSYLSGLGMPGGRYIDLTLGASGSTYTAPANGYLFLSKTATNIGQYISLDKSYYQEGATAGVSVETLRRGIQLLKGESVTVYYSVAGSTNYFRFIYAEGEN